jgi:hypothetical protein
MLKAIAATFVLGSASLASASPYHREIRDERIEHRVERRDGRYEQVRWERERLERARLERLRWEREHSWRRY